MMTTYSPLKKIAAFGFAAMVLAACAAPSYTTGSASSSASGGSASTRYLADAEPPDADEEAAPDV